MCRRALTAGVRQLAAACPARHALLPTVTAGLVVVSCTAKGEQLHGVAGVEAGAMHASSGQVRGPLQPGAGAQVAWRYLA